MNNELTLLDVFLFGKEAKLDLGFLDPFSSKHAPVSSNNPIPARVFGPDIRRIPKPMKKKPEDVLAKPTESLPDPEKLAYLEDKFDDSLVLDNILKKLGEKKEGSFEGSYRRQYTPDYGHIAPVEPLQSFEVPSVNIPETTEHGVTRFPVESSDAVTRQTATVTDLPASNIVYVLRGPKPNIVTWGSDKARDSFFSHLLALKYKEFIDSLLASGKEIDVDILRRGLNAFVKNNLKQYVSEQEYTDFYDKLMKDRQYANRIYNSILYIFSKYFGREYPQLVEKGIVNPVWIPQDFVPNKYDILRVVGTPISFPPRGDIDSGRIIQTLGPIYTPNNKQQTAFHKRLADPAFSALKDIHVGSPLDVKFGIYDRFSELTSLYNRLLDAANSYRSAYNLGMNFTTEKQIWENALREYLAKEKELVTLLSSTALQEGLNRGAGRGGLISGYVKSSAAGIQSGTQPSGGLMTSVPSASNQQMKNPTQHPSIDINKIIRFFEGLKSGVRAVLTQSKGSQPIPEQNQPTPEQKQPTQEQEKQHIAARRLAWFAHGIAQKYKQLNRPLTRELLAKELKRYLADYRTFPYFDYSMRDDIVNRAIDIFHGYYEGSGDEGKKLYGKNIARSVFGRRKAPIVAGPSYSYSVSVVPSRAEARRAFTYVFGTGRGTEFMYEQLLRVPVGSELDRQWRISDTYSRILDLFEEINSPEFEKLSPYQRNLKINQYKALKNILYDKLSNRFFLDALKVYKINPTAQTQEAQNQGHSFPRIVKILYTNVDFEALNTENVGITVADIRTNLNADITAKNIGKIEENINTYLRHLDALVRQKQEEGLPDEQLNRLRNQRNALSHLSSSLSIAQDNEDKKSKIIQAFDYISNGILSDDKLSPEEKVNEIKHFLAILSKLTTIN